MKTEATARIGDQRRFRRYNVSFPCRVKPRKTKRAGAAPEFSTETLDVSSGGVFFTAAAAWTVGTEIEVELYLPAKTLGGEPIGILGRGKIARVVSKEDGRVGIGATIEHYKFFHPKASPPQ